MKEFGFKGAMVNGFSQVDREDSVVYYDLPQYRPFWGVVESLNANAERLLNLKLQPPTYPHP